MFKKLILFLLFLYSFFDESYAALDSLTTISIDSQQYILHHVEAKESLYGISRRYNSTLAIIIRNNPLAKDSILVEGDILKIPIKSSLIVAQSIQDTLHKAPIYHTVIGGETLYAIKSMYEGLDISSLRKWNNLQGDTIRLGQRLIIAWEEILDSNIVVQDSANNIDSNVMYIPDLRDSLGMLVSKIKQDSIAFYQRVIAPYQTIYQTYADSGLLETSTRGIATWLPSSNNEEINFYALHSSIPRGTIVKVTNLMNDESVLVKVVGSLPPTQENKRVLMKLSYSVAKYLGVLDARFLAELKYFVEE